MLKPKMIDQKGFSPILIVGLLAAWIIAGTYLVQNGADFLPKAAEQEPLRPSAGKTEDCKKYDKDVNKEACQKDNDKICAADTVTYCDNRQGSPRAIRKSGGYYDPSDANADPDSGCVFDYREVSGKNSECGKPESKNGDVVFTTVDEAKKLDTGRAEEVKKTSDGKTSSGNKQEACWVDSSTAYYDAKVANNLVRFYAIMNGAGGLCVPADLGVAPQDKGKDKAGEEGRLFLCSESDGALVWMADIGNQLVPAVGKDEATAELTKQYYNDSGRLNDARKKIGLEPEKI